MSTLPNTPREWSTRKPPRESIAWTITLATLAAIGLVTVVVFLASLVP